MSLDSILKHILDEANNQRQEIIRQARFEAEAIIQEARLRAKVVSEEVMHQAREDCQRCRQRLLVSARLEAKKGLLSVKQELITEVFGRLKSGLKGDRFKKQQVLQEKIKEVPEDLNFYLAQLRQDYEALVAEILFK